MASARENPNLLAAKQLVSAFLKSVLMQND